MDFSFSNGLNRQTDGLPPINFNSVEQPPGLEARAAFTVNSQSVFRKDTDIVPTLIDDKRSYTLWGGETNFLHINRMGDKCLSIFSNS